MSQTIQVLVIIGIVLFVLSASVCLWCSIYLFGNLHQRLLRLEDRFDALADPYRHR